MPLKVHVTCVQPGSTRTELTRSWWRRLAAAEGRQAAAIEQDLAAETAIGRMVTGQGIAWPVCFPASPRSIALQGDVVVADDGADGEIHF